MAGLWDASTRVDGSAEEAFGYLKPYSDELTSSLHAAHKMSSRVNSPKNNDAGLVDEVKEG